MRTEAPVVVEAGSRMQMDRPHPIGRASQTPDGSMTVEPQTCRFWQAASQSGAIDMAALQASWDAIPEEKRTGDAIDRRLARQAVASGKLTLWQAQQILAGRGFALKIDKYILSDVIGQGGMGRVYLARDTRLHRKVLVLWHVSSAKERSGRSFNTRTWSGSTTRETRSDCAIW
jgi:hypothetical protein